MSDTLPLCHHLYDTGVTCNSAAATGHNYCAYHLRFRARRLRMAQYRARAERYHVKLPPLEDLYAVQAALSEIAEALAADMIDPKRAQALLSVLRQASINLRHPEKWQNNLYHSGQPALVDVAKDYGLPRDLDIDTPPETAFPPPPDPAFSDVSSPAQAAAPAATVEGPAFSGPAAGDTINVRPDHPYSPEFLELRDIRNRQGETAQSLRFRQLERNRVRRDMRLNRNRYTELAMRLNVKWAAERLAERIVAEKLSQAGFPPAPSDDLKDFDASVAGEMKRAAVSQAEIDACLAAGEVKIA